VVCEAGASGLTSVTTDQGTAAEQQSHDATTECGDTDSDLLHWNSPLRAISAAAAMGDGTYRFAQGS